MGRKLFANPLSSTCHADDVAGMLAAVLGLKWQLTSKDRSASGAWCLCDLPHSLSYGGSWRANGPGRTWDGTYMQSWRMRMRMSATLHGARVPCKMQHKAWRITITRIPTSPNLCCCALNTAHAHLEVATSIFSVAVPKAAPQIG